MAKKIIASHLKKVIEFDNEVQCEMYITQKVGSEVVDKKVDDNTGRITIIINEPYGKTAMLCEGVNKVNDKDGVFIMPFLITRKGRTVQRKVHEEALSCSGCGANCGAFHQYNCKKEVCPVCGGYTSRCNCTVGYTLRKLEPKKKK